MWIVVETAPYEGCFEHWGGFGTEAEADAFAAKKQAKHSGKKPVFQYDVIGLTPPEIEEPIDE